MLFAVLFMLAILSAAVGGIAFFAAGMVATAVVYGAFSVTGIALAVAGVIGVINGIRYHAQTTIPNLIFRIVTLVLAVLILIGNLPPAWAAYNDWRISQQQEQIPDPPAADDPTSLDEYRVDYDQAQLEAWLEEFDPNWQINLRAKWDDSSLPEHYEERRAALIAAGGDFDDPVSTPMQDLKALLDGQYDEAMLARIQRGIQVKIITDPLYADQFFQAFQYVDPVLSQLNPWLAERLDSLNEAFSNTDRTYRGVFGLLNNDYTAQLDDVFYDNVRMAILFGRLRPVKVAALESAHNWHLPLSVNASDTRIVESDKQESATAIIFEARYKTTDGGEGSCAVRLGINVWDKRVELFDPQAPVQPVTPSEPPKDNPGTNDPGKKPDPKHYDVYLIGYDWSDKTTVVLKTTTYKTDVADKTELTIPFVPVDGYNIHPGYETVKVTVNGDDAKAVFYYDKAPAQVNNYKVTAIGYDWADKTTIVVPEYIVYPAVTNGTYTVNAKTDVSGYTVHPGYEQVKVKVSGRDTPAVFYYDKATDYSLSYQRGYWSGSNWIPIDKTPVFVERRVAGTTYGFSVSAPNSGRVDMRYVLSEKSYYTGAMPAQDTVIKVPCKIQWLVDVSFKKVDGNTVTKAFEPYVDWIDNGAPLNVVNPTLPGYTPDKVVSRSRMTEAVSETVFYWPNGRPQDGNGAKDPVVDPVNTPQDGDPNKSNADKGGGTNTTTDGNDEHQTTDPGAKDYPTQGSTTTTPGGGGNNNNNNNNNTTSTSGNGGSTATVTQGDHQTSGETGKPAGGNETVTADDGGTTHGGTTDSNPITTVDNTTVTTTTENNNGGTTTTTENTGGQTFDGQYSGGEPK